MEWYYSRGVNMEEQEWKLWPFGRKNLRNKNDLHYYSSLSYIYPKFPNKMHSSTHPAELPRITTVNQDEKNATTDPTLANGPWYEITIPDYVYKQ